MSGHNPHSRVSQPVNSSSWNHLQVPSYMPRPPQLAHMSSDRTLQSSPLIWPNTNPADAFYNYMALTAAAAVANSNPKNTALDINPLLPFVRTPAMPFNSVDLSLASSTATANRNSLTPSPRTQLSPGSGSSSNRYSKADADDNNGGNNKLNTDSLAFLNEMSEQLAVMRSNRNLPGLSRESSNLNSDLSNFRLNGANDKSRQRNEPMDFGRELNAPNPFENESLSQSVHLQQLLGLAPPIASSITPNLNDLSKSLLSIFNNTSTPNPLLISPKSSTNFPSRPTDVSKGGLSNDDSRDSQCNGDDGAGKQLNTRYRRRKPQKTVRLSNELSDANGVKNGAAKDDHKSDAVNGLNFPLFHSELPQAPPQTQSIDLSQHCAGQEMFENGLANYKKDSELGEDTTDGASKETNPKDDIAMNLFGGVNFNHLRSNVTTDLTTFPNTDDLVKKVEELVKCNERNCFVDANNFGPMELTKSHADKLEPFDPARMANGISEAIKSNDHSNSQCNGTTPIDKVDEKCDNNQPLPIQNGEAKAINSEAPNQVQDTNNHATFSADGFYQTNETFDTPANDTSNKDDVAQATTSASCSETQSPAPKKAAVKKPANNRLNGKTGKPNAKTNQKNGKASDKSEKKSDIKKANTKDDTAAEALNKFRGPYVHVERDGAIDVINAPLNEEIAEKQSKFKKTYISQRPADRNSIRGLHVSTLSNKYDAVTTDISWMCVFCKLGPHKYGLGDLFGPFLLSTESEDFQLAQIDPKEDLFRSNRKKANMTCLANVSAVAAMNSAKNAIPTNGGLKKKRKLNQVGSTPAANDESSAPTTEIDIFHGMTRASDTSCEVWAHEDCIVWASGVHIIGARVIGLETAVWGSVRHQCNLCNQYGAMLSCLKRTCQNAVHVPCAKRCGWDLDEHSFQSRCAEHLPKHEETTEQNHAAN